MKYLKQHKNPSIVLLFGTRSRGVVQAIMEIGFPGSYCIDSAVFEDGVWLWKKVDVEIEVNTPKYSHQFNASARFLPHLSNSMPYGTAKNSKSNCPYAK